MMSAAFACVVLLLLDTLVLCSWSWFLTLLILPFSRRYLKSPEVYENKIESDADLVDLDEEFKENHLGMLERFYQMFESVYKYVSDFNTYVQEMIDGVFIHQTIEACLLDVDGKQLMAEAIYLYGSMLLLMDRRFEGSTREMMLVSYYRYKGSSTIPNIDEVCKLCRSTGFSASTKSTENKNYPIEYFARFPVMPELVAMVIGRLRADDIYNQSSAYPSPEHRSTALGIQAAMLYVILFMAPNILNKEMSTMREIVDKHFSDNWVISYYMGVTVDLTESWDSFKAAKAALANITEKSNISDLIKKFSGKAPKLIASIKQVLTEGVLTEQYVLENISKLLNLLRECNTTIRWLMLHRNSRNKKIRDEVISATTSEDIMVLLLNTAQFEFVLKNMFQGLLDTKRDRWEEYKKESKERIMELSEYFSGEKALTRIKKDEHLQGWFNNLANEIDALDFDKSIVAGRKITHIMQALEEVQEFHQIETSLQIKQFLADTRQFLTKMIRTINIRESVIGVISIVSDFSYAWEIILDYSSLMHARIKNDPSCVLFLRATFLKLVSILDLPLLRINQCGSKDVVSVSEYYSSSLVRYVRSILEVIPKSMFIILNDIIQLLTYKLKPLPMKLERTFLKDYSQLDLRLTLSRNTHQVSVFTQGILTMERTLYGVIEVDPKQMLEDGIRKELVIQISTALNELLVFKTGKLIDFEQKLVALGARLDGFKRSFEYIQDYVNIYGLKIWQEEFSRIINYFVEQECNGFLKKKIYYWQSQYQSDAIPIPNFNFETSGNTNDGAPVATTMNFMGRLASELLRQTDFRTTMYIDGMQGWYDEAEREVVGIRTFDMMNRGLGIFGLTGADRLISFMIVRDMQSWVRSYRKFVDEPFRNYIADLSNALYPSSRLPANAKLYPLAFQRVSKFNGLWLDCICKLGQAQLLRRHIAHELKFTAQMDSKTLSCVLHNANIAVLEDIRLHYSKPEAYPYPDEKSKLLPELTLLLESCGIHDPFSKIYITTEALEGLPCILFLFVVIQAQKLTYNSKWCALVRASKKDAIDGAPFIVGLITLLKQFHSSCLDQFIAFLGQYVRFAVSISAGGEGSTISELPADVLAILLFLEEFCKFSSIPREIITNVIPPYIFDRFKHAASAN